MTDEKKSNPHHDEALNTGIQASPGTIKSIRDL
jgi:hypothetical protein